MSDTVVSRACRCGRQMQIWRACSVVVRKVVFLCGRCGRTESVDRETGQVSVP